jgi:hypothetical protein
MRLKKPKVPKVRMAPAIGKQPKQKGLVSVPAIKTKTRKKPF